MEFVLGFLGALLAVGLFAGGVILGWRGNEKFRDQTQRVTAEQLTEEQKRRVAEEQEAWMALHNYSVEDAYNVRPQTQPPDKE